MAQLETRFHEAGRGCGKLYVRLKVAFEYLLDFGMIAYQCYDCVSDGINVKDYYSSNSLDVSGYNESVYRAFLFSLVVSCVCALTSIIGYSLSVFGLSKRLYKRQTSKNNTYKLGRLIVFISLFVQVSFEETIQCIIMYYYIVRCSVIFSFWKTSLFVCTTFSLIISGYTFLKAAYLWFKKDSISRKYPSCLESCYNLGVSHVGCVALCLFASLLALALFILNIVTLADIIKYSEVDIPHVLARNKFGGLAPIKITSVKNLVTSHDKKISREIPCANLDIVSSHFLEDGSSRNCTTAIFTLQLLGKPSKRLQYQLHYCYKNDNICTAVKATNITLEYSHNLCSSLSPVLDHLGDPEQVVKTTSVTKQLPSNSSKT